MNLIERIFNEMATDDEDTDRQSERMIADFEAADTDTRIAIDNMFVSLCGWSLTSLIEKAKQ